jgi:methionyl-tRNA formyltransferase
MTDLPYGRGGSPLQNLIARGHKETKISALRVNDGIDTGPVFLKKPLSLLGTAEEIFLRAGDVVYGMIDEIIEQDLQPKEQQGEATIFKRRKRADGDISSTKDINTIYDYIRMLDAEGYPNAFIETQHFTFEFTRASLKKDGILADVKITYKK